MSRGTLYGFALSPFVRGVRIALAEKGVAYDHQPHDLEEIKTPAYAAINPFHKMPSWVASDGFTIYETPAILRFIDETEPGVSLTPAMPRHRAAMAQWMGVAGSILYPVGITQLFLQRVVMPMMGGTADEAIVESATVATSGHLDAVAGALGGAFLAGPDFSQADILVGTMLDLIERCPEGATLFAARPAVADYLVRLRGRDSFVATFPAMFAAQPG